MRSVEARGMPDQIDPGFTPGARKRILLISSVFIGFGIVLFPMALAAYRSGEPIHMISNRQQVYGWEGLLISFLSVIVGIGGIWGAMRRRK